MAAIEKGIEPTFVTYEKFHPSGNNFKSMKDKATCIYKPFELARIAYAVIGDQNVVSFCNSRGLSRSLVSRMLNGSLKSPPRVSTIHKFVAGDEAAANQMFRACGYPPEKLSVMYEKLNTPVAASDRFFSPIGFFRMIALVLKYTLGLYLTMRMDGLYEDASKNDSYGILGKSSESVINGDAEPCHGKFVFLTSADFKGKPLITYKTIDDPSSKKRDLYLHTKKRDHANVYEWETLTACVTDVESLCDRLRSFVANDEKLANEVLTLFSFTRDTKTTQSRYVIIPALQSEKDKGTNDVVLSTAYYLKTYIEKNKSLFTNPKTSDSKARIKFLIATNSGEVNDIFLNTFPNFGLDIEMLLLDADRIIEHQEIPNLV